MKRLLTDISHDFDRWRDIRIDLEKNEIHFTGYSFINHVKDVRHFLIILRVIEL
jgi:hypothetical protein